MSCKELILLIRTNKGKCIVYVLFGAIITFILCSVLYLLITVNNIGLKSIGQSNSLEQPNSYKIGDALTSSGVELHDNNITKNISEKTNLTANMVVLMVKFSDYKRQTSRNLTLIKLDYKNEFEKYKEETSRNLTLIKLDYKNEFEKYKEETSRNLTLIKLDYKEDITEYKEEFEKYKKKVVDNLTVIAYRVTDNKKEFISLIKNLTNSIASLRIMHLVNKVEISQNLTFISSEINRLYMLVKNNNKTIHNVLSGVFAYIGKYKNDLGKNITKLRTIMKENKANIVENEVLFGKKINGSLEGSRLFWEKCPISWKDVGGVYPVKVCEYK